MDWKLLVKERIYNIGTPLDVLGFCRFVDVLRFESFFWSLRTSLLCIVGELAGGGYLAVGVGDR